MKNMWMLSLLVAACGDNYEIADAGVTDAPGDAGPSPTRAVVVTPSANFAAGEPGVLSVLDVATQTVRMNVGPAMAVGSDPILRHFDGELFVVNRTSNNVTIIDDRDFSLVEQIATGAGSNPQDVAVVGNTLVVATFGNKGAVAVTRGSSTVTEIDLSADDPDAKPNCNSIYRVGSELFVSCELLDDTQQFLPPRGPGKVYVLNAATLAVTRTITLLNVNPFGLLELLPEHAPNAGDLVIPTINFGTGAGCIERIPTGGSSTTECVVTNATMGNFASRVDVRVAAFTGPFAPIIEAPMMYAVVPQTNFTNSDLHSFDLSAMVWSTAHNPSTQVLGDLAVCPNGAVVVSESPATGTGGLRIYSGGEHTAALPVGVKPASSHGLACY